MSTYLNAHYIKCFQDILLLYKKNENIYFAISAHNQYDITSMSLFILWALFGSGY